jgi:hypothetical protein
MAADAVRAYASADGDGLVGTGPQQLFNEICGDGQAWTLIDNNTSTIIVWQYSGTLAGHVQQGSYDQPWESGLASNTSCPTSASNTWN